MVTDVNADERRNVTLLLRWLSVFVAFPSLTIAGAFLIWDAGEHALHIAGLLPLGLAALGMFYFSPRVAIKFYPPDLVETA